MKIGAVYPQIELGGLPNAVRAYGYLEELGYDHLLAYDHVLGAEHADRHPPLIGPYNETHPFHDPFVMFAYLAGRTNRLEFVTGVLILPQRQTVLVAKQATDLALLSGGRLRLGVGVGWNPVEYEALGQDFSTRGRRADEQIRLMRRLWSENVVTFEGFSDRVSRAALLPRPGSGIPIWIGGMSEPAFRRAARYGDGFIYGGTVATARHFWDRTRRLLEEEGRQIEGFGAEYVVGSRTADPHEIAVKVEQWQNAGGTHASVVTLYQGWDSPEAHLDYLGRVANSLGLR